MASQTAKYEKRKANELKQLARFERESAKPVLASYVRHLVLILIVFDMFDQAATNMYGQFDDAITMFFAKLGASAEVWVRFDAFGEITSQGADYVTYQAMNGKLVLGSTVGYAMLAVAPFYKALADKYGRKPFFIINCVGLTFAVLVGFCSYYIFKIGTPFAETLGPITLIFSQVLIVFFTIQDIQMLYVFEVVDEAKRATLFGITKGCGLFASVFVISSRLFSVRNIAGIQWQMVYLGVMVFGLIALFVSVFGLKESRPFMQQRIAYLKMSDEEREANRIAANKNKVGVLGGLKTIFKNRQLKMLAISLLCISVANNMVCSKANSIMIQSGMSTMYITIALIVAKTLEALLNMGLGWFSDRFGRKPVALALAIFNTIGMTLFCFIATRTKSMDTFDWTTRGVMNAAFAGVSFGVALSSYLCLFDQINLMTSESSPTYLRSSIVGCSSMFRITAVVALVIQSLLALIAATPTAWVCYILSVPFILGAATIIMLTVKETKGKSIADIDSEFEIKATE